VDIDLFDDDNNSGDNKKGTAHHSFRNFNRYNPTFFYYPFLKKG
jgi:hypothetical protein